LGLFISYEEKMFCEYGHRGSIHNIVCFCKLK
jgi:hypothetical protein